MSLLDTVMAQGWKYGCIALGVALLALGAHDVSVLLSKAATEKTLATAQGDLKVRTGERDALLASNATNEATIKKLRLELKVRDDADRNLALLNKAALDGIAAELKDADAAAAHANAQLAKAYRNPDCAAKLRMDLSCAF